MIFFYRIQLIHKYEYEPKFFVIIYIQGVNFKIYIYNLYLYFYVTTAYFLKIILTLITVLKN